MPSVSTSTPTAALAATPRTRTGLEVQGRLLSEGVSIATSHNSMNNKEITSPLMTGSNDFLPMPSKNPALRAAQLSTASASSSTTTPLTIRTRRQLRYPLTGPEVTDELQNNLAQSNLIIATSAAKDSIAAAGRRSVLTKSPPATGSQRPLNSDSALRGMIDSQTTERASASGSPAIRNDADKLSSHVTTPLYQYRGKALSQDPLPASTSDTVLRTSSGVKPVLIDVGSPVMGKRQSAALTHLGSLLARAVSPTDIRRTKRAPDGISALPASLGSPMLDTASREWSAVATAAPSLPRRKSSSPSSPRASPDPKHGFSANLSLSSQSSYNSLRPPSATLQHRPATTAPVSRNSSTRSRTTLSSAGDVPEMVPPVPAIPKAYGSSRNVSQEQHIPDFEDAVLHTVPNTQDLASANKPATDFNYMPSAFGSSGDAARHRRGLTLGTELDGTNHIFTHTSTARQSLHPLRLPPLNLLPLSQPTAAKIDEMSLRQQDVVNGTATPPGSRKNNRTPSTPMTASKATFSSNDTRFVHDLGSLTAARARPAFRTPVGASSGTSSPSVFLTPSPGPSPAPVSEAASTPLPSLPDVEEQLNREQKRVEMLASRRRLEDSRSPETLGQRKVAIMKPLSAIRDGTATTPSSPGHRNFSQKLQQLRDEMSLQKQDLGDPSSSLSGVRRAVSLNPMKMLQMENDHVATALLPAASIGDVKTQVLSTKPVNQSTRQITATAAKQVTAEAPAAARPTTTQKVLPSRDSRSALKGQEGDALFDVDAFAADEEMRKLAVSRKDFEVAAKELDELKRRIYARDRLAPTQALRSENLNIFERGEIIDYKDIYFCGSKNAKKFIGDLTSQAANFGFDDERGDYNLVIGDHLAYRYEVLNLLGKGSFGQVVRCIDHETGGLVAVKIIRNKKRFHQQALVEVNILRQLKEWVRSA